MITKEEIRQLRRIMVFTRDTLDELIEHLGGHLSQEGKTVDEVPHYHQTSVSKAILALRQPSITSENPTCDVCGALTARCGTCYRCYNCGNSLGCS